MQFKVPQDVLRADKIVSFLTLRQLIIVIIGGAVAYSLYIILSRQYYVEIWMPPVIFVALLTVAFAFIKFHDIVFEKLVLIFVEYKFKPRVRTWQKMRGDVLISVFSTSIKQPTANQENDEQVTEQQRRQKLEEISKIVDKKITL